jgi:proteic killer suppression protein
MNFNVELTKQAVKDLKKVPTHIKSKLLLWVDSVEKLGIYEVRKSIGYHDEPLSGQRKGQRSIRLSKGYRAIYSMSKSGAMEIVSVEEVNKHEY